MSRLDEYFESIAKTNGAEGPLTFLAPKLVAPGVLPATDAFNAQSQGGMRRWIVDGRTAYDVDEALSPDPVELAGDIMYQSFRAVTLHEDLFDFFMCALYVGIHKNGIMLNSVEDPNKGQGVPWQDEQLAKRNRGERAISLLNFRSKYCIAVWSVHSHVESRRIYFVTLASELEYEYSNNFPVEEFVEQRQMSRKPSERSSDKRLAFSETVVAVRLKMQEAEEATTTEATKSPTASQDPAKKAEEFSKAVEDQAVVQTAMKEIKEWLRTDAANPPIEEPTSEQDAVPKGEQMTPKPSESSKEPRNYLAEMDERLTEAIEGSGTTVTNLGPRRIQGSLFVFPGQKVRKEAVPPASDVVASASDEEVQMTKIPSESSKEPESSSPPPPKEPTNSWPEALAAWTKELRDSGTTVTEGGGTEDNRLTVHFSRSEGTEACGAACIGCCGTGQRRGGLDDKKTIGEFERALEKFESAANKADELIGGDGGAIEQTTQRFGAYGDGGGRTEYNRLTVHFSRSEGTEASATARRCREGSHRRGRSQLVIAARSGAGSANPILIEKTWGPSL